MTREVVELFAPLGEGLVLDATFGRGGHARALLQQTSCRIVALDCDPEAVVYGRQEPFFQAHAARFRLEQGFFAQSAALLARQNLHSLDGILFDYGLSSPQLDDPKRGFSFQRQGPLDMRMAQSGTSAQELLERISEEELTQALRLCGERHARRIAHALFEARAQGKLPQDTLALAALVRAQSMRHARIDAATKTFMALRIAVNDELTQIAQGLEQADRLLRTGGRIVAIAFHSLEDRIVKRQFSTWAGRDATGCSRHRASLQDLPSNEKSGNHESGDQKIGDQEIGNQKIGDHEIDNQRTHPLHHRTPFRPLYRLLLRRPHRASALEVAANPRARSARLRAVEKLARANLAESSALSAKTSRAA